MSEIDQYSLQGKEMVKGKTTEFLLNLFAHDFCRETIAVNYQPSKYNGFVTSIMFQITSL